MILDTFCICIWSQCLLGLHGHISVWSIHLENTRPFCIFLQVHAYQTFSEDFFLRPPPHTHTLTVTMGRWRGLPETGVDLARTFTADTFFAHLLTLRMFRVYVFMSISQSGHMADTNGTSDILFYVFFLSKSSHELISFLYFDVFAIFLYCTHCDTSLDSGKW